MAPAGIRSAPAPSLSSYGRYDVRPAIEGVMAALQRLREQGRSLLVVEQRVDLALRVFDRVYVLAGGEIVVDEAADAIDSEGRALIAAHLG